MARFFYSILITLLIPFAFLRLWWKGRKQPGYRQRWAERLGVIPLLSSKPRLWVHAVSVGETVAAAPLVRTWQQRHPDWAVLVTTTTPTGSAQVRQLFGQTVEHCYLPFDLPWAARLFLKRCQPRLAIVMETEIWPNLYAASRALKLPLIMANARLSDKSFKAYQRLGRLVRPTLRCVTQIASRGPEDARRFVALGAHPQAVEAMGNVKFDLAIPTLAQSNGAAWRRWWGPERPVWIAASTHPGEEEQVLQAFGNLLDTQPKALLVLAPRHPDRTQEILKLIQGRPFKVKLRSSVQEFTSTPLSEAGLEVQILLVDTLGELMTFYAASDLAYVGGSMVPTGGHNPLEPLTLGKPVISGPHVFNFRDLYAELHALGGVTWVDTPTQLGQEVQQAFESRQKLTLPPAVQHWLQANQGSTARLVARAEQLVFEPAQ